MWRNYVHRVLCLPSRVAHSLVWILPDCHVIVALLVMSGKQPSSELLHTLRFICLCVGHLSTSVQYLRHLLHNTEALLVFQATFSYVSPSRLTSTTQPLTTVPGYHTISTIVGLSARGERGRGGKAGRETAVYIRICTPQRGIYLSIEWCQGRTSRSFTVP